MVWARRDIHHSDRRPLRHRPPRRCRLVARLFNGATVRSNEEHCAEFGSDAIRHARTNFGRARWAAHAWAHIAAGVAQIIEQVAVVEHAQSLTTANLHVTRPGAAFT